MSTPGSPNPTLVDWLRAQDDETLATLLRLRPDLGVPPPADLVVLATRAGVRASVTGGRADGPVRRQIPVGTM